MRKRAPTIASNQSLQLSKTMTTNITPSTTMNNCNNSSNFSNDNNDATASSSLTLTLSSSSLFLCRVGPNRQLVLHKPILFMKKVVLVVAGSFFLLPLIMYKSKLSGIVFAICLILIHVVVLVVYLYKVKFRELDVDRSSLGGRLLGLIVTIWLLTVVSGWTEGTSSIIMLGLQMVVLSFVHASVLAFLMVAVEPIIDNDEDNDDDENDCHSDDERCSENNDVPFADNTDTITDVPSGGDDGHDDNDLLLG